MKKNYVIGVLLALLVGAVAFPYFRTHVAAQPGDANDPLVTRRYVDEQIAVLTTEMAILRAMVEASAPAGGVMDLQAIANAVFPEVMIAFEIMYGEMLRNAGHEFVSINPQSGQRVLLENGAEIILRTGSATAIDNGLGNGLVNMTAGRDMLANEEVALNHLLIAPRTDGRGILLTSNAWVMVRGGFTVQ